MVDITMSDEITMFCNECDDFCDMAIVSGTEHAELGVGGNGETIELSAEYVCEACGQHYAYSQWFHNDSEDYRLVKKE